MTKEKLLDSITTLVTAGYSKEEINTLLGIGGAPEDKTPEAQENKTQEAQEDKTQENTNSIFENMNVISAGISKAIIEELQKSNIMGSRMPAEQELTGEDIMATVLDLIDEK